MQSGTSSKASPSPAAIVGIVGGAVLVIGSFLTWATASINIDALANAIGVDPALLQGAVPGSTSFSVKGMDSGADGTFTLIAGIAAVVVAIVLIMKADLKKPMGAILIIAGLVGGGVALYDLSKVNDVKQEAVDAAGGGLAAAGIDAGVLDEVFDVSAGIGIWVCIAGGLIAIVGGVMAFAAKPAPAMAGGPAAPMGSGFDAPSAQPRQLPRPPRPRSRLHPRPRSPRRRCRPPSRSPRRRRTQRPSATRCPRCPGTTREARRPSVLTTTLTIDTGGRRVVDVSDRVRRFAAEAGSDGLLHVFLPHATAGLALIETGAGTEPDLEETLERLLPRDDRYRHRHGSVGHGGDHVLPAFVSPSLVLPVVAGDVALGIWQSVVVVDPNRENDTRTLRLSFLEG